MKKKIIFSLFWCVQISMAMQYELPNFMVKEMELKNKEKEHCKEEYRCNIGKEIIVNNEYCKYQEKFNDIAKNCSCDTLHELLNCAVNQPHGRIYIENLLSRKDYDPCGRNIDSMTPLAIALKGKASVQTIQQLLKRGALIHNSKALNSQYKDLTTLGAAAYFGRPDVTLFLLQDGTTKIDPDAIPLIYKQKEAAEIFLKKLKESPISLTDLAPIEIHCKLWEKASKIIIERTRRFTCLEDPGILDSIDSPSKNNGKA